MDIYITAALLLFNFLLHWTEKQSSAKDLFPQYAFSEGDDLIGYKVMRTRKGKRWLSLTSKNGMAGKWQNEFKNIFGTPTCKYILP